MTYIWYDNSWIDFNNFSNIFYEDEILLSPTEFF